MRTVDLLHALWEAFAADPFDRATANELADALTDAGEDALALAVRWMLRERKRPYWTDRNNNFSWWDKSRRDLGGLDPESDIPHDVLAALPGGDNYDDAHRAYPTFRDAVADLAQALQRLEVRA